MIKHGLNLLLLVLPIVPSLVYAGGGWIFDADGKVRVSSGASVRGNQAINARNTIEGEVDSRFATSITNRVSASAPVHVDLDAKPIEVTLSNFGGNNRFSLGLENNRLFSIDRVKSSHDRKAITNVQVNMNMERMIEACGRVVNYNPELEMIDQ